MAHDPLDPASLIGHVKDSTYFLVPRALTGDAATTEPGHVEIPQFYTGQPIFAPEGRFIEPLDLKMTRFMVLEVIAALVIVVLGVMLAQKLAGGRPARGRFWNGLEAVLLFIRDEVARPAIGMHDAASVVRDALACPRRRRLAASLAAHPLSVLQRGPLPGAARRAADLDRA